MPSPELVLRLGRIPGTVNRHGKAWGKAYAERRDFRDLTYWLAKAQHGTKPALGFCEAHATIYWPKRGPLPDPSNLSHLWKGILDGLVAAKVLPGDRAEHVRTHEPVVVRGPARTEIKLREQAEIGL